MSDKFPHRFSTYIEDQIGPRKFKKWGIVECMSVAEHESLLREERAKCFESAAGLVENHPDSKRHVLIENLLEWAKAERDLTTKENGNGK